MVPETDPQPTDRQPTDPPTAGLPAESARTGVGTGTEADPAGGPRPRVEIEYCTQCRWLPRAAWLAQELLATFEGDVAAVALVPGTGGVFTVRVGEDVVWDRRERGFPEPSAVKRAVRDIVAPGRDLGHADR